jgi:hypothetical protein
VLTEDTSAVFEDTAWNPEGDIEAAFRDTTPIEVDAGDTDTPETTMVHNSTDRQATAGRDPDGSNIATHPSGAKMYVSTLAQVWIIETIQPLEYSNATAYPTTHSGTHDDIEDALEYARSVATGIDDGRERYAPINIVRHDGQTSSIEREQLLTDGLYIPEYAPADFRFQLADVFAVRNSAVTDELLSELQAAKHRFAAATYGFDISQNDGSWRDAEVGPYPNRAVHSNRR